LIDQPVRSSMNRVMASAAKRRSRQWSAIG
jgi:hypothetical protein